MARQFSPYTAPVGEFVDERYTSPTGYIPTPSATPSPRAPYYPGQQYAPPPQTPQRPVTRAHFRHPSAGYEAGSFSPSSTISPRYTSGGQYATGNPNVSSTRKHLWSSTSSPSPARSAHQRRSSFSYRTSTPHGVSDEEEYYDERVTYVGPTKSRSRRYSNVMQMSRGNGTDHYRSEQFAPHEDDRKAYASTRHSTRTAHPNASNPHPVPQRHAETPAPDGSRRSTHTRRSSAAIPPISRPQTVRPEAARRPEPVSSRRCADTSSRHTSKKPAEARRAAEEDARRAGLPAGYSLKNWDPTEEPILLLGSVFDSNSLGKWIYDWTVFRSGPNSPIAEAAGGLWLMLIQLAGKTKRAMKTVPSVRRIENRDLLEEFITASDRLTDKLRDLLSTCEQPMLEASKKGHKSKLGKGAGVEFINTLFGDDRMGAQTEGLMESMRLWNLRFDANIEAILKEPTK